MLYVLYSFGARCRQSLTCENYSALREPSLHALHNNDCMAAAAATSAFPTTVKQPAPPRASTPPPHGSGLGGRV